MTDTQAKTDRSTNLMIVVICIVTALSLAAVHLLLPILHDPAFTILIVPIIVAGLLLGKWGGISVGFAAVVAACFFAGYAFQHGHIVASIISGSMYIVIGAAVGHLHDLNQRVRGELSSRAGAEDSLRLRQSYLSAIIENQPGLLWMKDRDGKFLAVNTKFANSCGLDNPELLIGKTDFDIWPHELAAGYVADDDKVIKSGNPRMVEEPISDRGDVRWFETFKAAILDKQGTILGTTGYSRDITERKRMEVELQKAQKLESLGVLAGGIAHDFNNLLTGIFGFIDLARTASKDPRVSGYLETTLSSINRARALTMQLLTFAKGGAPVRKITPLVPFIKETAQFALSGSTISCKFFLAENLRLCNIDKNQIGQVIDNIVINAQQAMPSGGEIEITAQNVSLGEKEHCLLPKGDYVVISIKDSGIGMHKDVMPRIFDPFYTTKTKGHGLGLATCYSIVNRHGGCIDVGSEPGKGSVFHVYLPASPGPVAANAPAMAARKGSGSIIVMDDEDAIRRTYREMLESLGFSVVCQNDGKAAVDFYRSEVEAKRSYAAMIFDLTIPGGMGGIEAVAEVRKFDGKIPVFVASGYADDPVITDPAKYGFTASLSKPFTIEELSEMLNKNMAH